MTARFKFFSRSADRHPGQGAGEYCHNSIDYSDLASIPHWRRELSNFSQSCTVEYLGHTFPTVEHCFQYAKICKADPEAAAAFSIESGSKLSRGCGAEARSKRKLAILNQTQLGEWAEEKPGFLKEMWNQKLHKSPLFREVLLKTRGAELWHIAGRGSSCERWSDLEALRDEILTTTA